MAEGLENLKQGYQAFADGDIERATENWSDDITWEGSQAEEIPGGGTHEGKEAVVENLKDLLGAYDSFSAVPDEWVDGGETVVVLGHMEATLKEQGAELKLPFVHVWRLDDDGQATRIQVLTDTAVVVQAHADEEEAKQEEQEQESEDGEDGEDSGGEKSSGSEDDEGDKGSGSGSGDDGSESSDSGSDDDENEGADDDEESAKDG